MKQRIYHFEFQASECQVFQLASCILLTIELLLTRIGVRSRTTFGPCSNLFLHRRKVQCLESPADLSGVTSGDTETEIKASTPVHSVLLSLLLEQETMVLRLLLFLLGTSSIAQVFSEECTVTHSEVEDDSPAILKAFTDCQVDSVVTFSQVNYSVFTPISLTGLSNYAAGISPVSLADRRC